MNVDTVLIPPEGITLLLVSKMSEHAFVLGAMT